MDFLKDFGVKPILLAAQVVNFLILLFILNKLLYKPILKVLNERKKKIEDSLKNAEEIEARLLKTEEDREKILSKANQEAQKLLEETKKEMEVLKEEMKQNAQLQVEQIIKKGEESAKAEVEKMKKEFMSNIADVIAIGLEKITGKILNKKDQKDIIDREIRNLS